MNLDNYTFDYITIPCSNKIINYYSEDGKRILCQLFNITVVNESKEPFNMIKKISLPILIAGPSLFILTNLLSSFFYKPKIAPPLIPNRYKRARII